MDLSIGLDFTSSNLDPNSTASKHYIGNSTSNAYQTTMKSFIETFLGLTESKRVHLFGFGARLNYPGLKSESTSFVFPLTGDPRPGKDEVAGVEGALETYANSLGFLELAGPTYFSHMLREVLQRSDKKNKTHTDSYSVLLAVTDGMFLDVQETIDLIVEASYKPFSLILVGLGDDHKEFEGFYHLASLDCRDSKGKKPARNLCRFVHFEYLIFIQ